MGLQVSHGVHSEVGGIQCGGIHQGGECNLDCPELSGTETPFDRKEFLSARLFRFHGGDGQTIRAGIHLAAGAGGAAFGGAEHGVGASAAFKRLLTGPFEGLTEISPRLCRGSFNFLTLSMEMRRFEDYPASVRDARSAYANLVGDVVLEFEPGGEVVRRFSLLDILDPYRIGYDSLGEGLNVRFPGADNGTRDWSHANALVHQPIDDSYIVTVRHQDADRQDRPNDRRTDMDSWHPRRLARVAPSRFC